MVWMELEYLSEESDVCDEKNHFKEESGSVYILDTWVLCVISTAAW